MIDHIEIDINVESGPFFFFFFPFFFLSNPPSRSTPVPLRKMNAATIQYELDFFDSYLGDYDDLEIDEDGPVWVDVYVYGSYTVRVLD